MCTAAVWGLLLGLRTWTSARQRRRPRSPFPQHSSATTHQSAEDKYETLLRFQAASDEFYHQKLASCKSEDEYKILQRFQAKSDEFYCRKRESIFAQLTPGNSVHRPIVPSTWKPRTRRTPTRDMCVEDLAPRRIDFYKVTRHSRATRNQPNNRCFSTPSGALISSAAAGGEEQNRPIS